jgi:hypothetical protein
MFLWGKAWGTGDEFMEPKGAVSRRSLGTTGLSDFRKKFVKRHRETTRNDIRDKPDKIQT